MRNLKNKNKSKKKGKPRIVSLFSGAMGLDIGLEKAGFSLAVAIECDPIAVNTIKLNKPRLPVIAKRLENTTTAEIIKTGKLNADADLIVVGGPSCQAFSTAGNRLSLEDPRGAMFREFIRVVRDLRPRFFLMENVRGLLSAAIKHRPLAKRGPGHPHLAPEEMLGSALEQVTTELKKLGYYVTFDLLNAADYGVPQSRQRLFFLGSRDGEDIKMPLATHSESGANGSRPWMTLRKAIGTLKKKHHFREFSPRKKRLLSKIPAGGNWRDLPRSKQEAAIGAAFHSWGGRSGFLRRLSWDKPCPSLVTTPNGNATCLCHPKATRPLSLEEYARIQGFPTDWKFDGSIDQQYRQIGNAVPIGLSKAIGKSLYAALSLPKRYSFRGKIECARTELLATLVKGKRTYLNPRHMKTYTSKRTISDWMKGNVLRGNSLLRYAKQQERI